MRSSNATAPGPQVVQWPRNAMHLLQVSECCCADCKAQARVPMETVLDGLQSALVDLMRADSLPRFMVGGVGACVSTYLYLTADVLTCRRRNYGGIFLPVNLRLR